MLRSGIGQGVPLKSDDALVCRVSRSKVAIVGDSNRLAGRRGVVVQRGGSALLDWLLVLPLVDGKLDVSLVDDLLLEIAFAAMVLQLLEFGLSWASLRICDLVG